MMDDSANHSNDELFDLFEDLERNTEPVEKSEIVRAPFAYPGAKSRSVDHILPHLPNRRVYVEPFGGSGAVLLARRPSPLDVFNDRYSGVTAFYQCLRDHEMMLQLCNKMEFSVHSREEFWRCKDTWENMDDPVERAFRWLYMNTYSFGSLGRNWGRSITGSNNMAKKFVNKIPKMFKIHERLKTVQIENRDWYQCVKEYDSHDTVFYLDPPYIDSDTHVYKDNWTEDDQRLLLQFIDNCKGFVALSGYANPINECIDWDDYHTWEVFCSIESVTNSEANNKAGINESKKRGKAKEALWIKT